MTYSGLIRGVPNLQLRRFAIYISLLCYRSGPLRPEALKSSDTTGQGCGVYLRCLLYEETRSNNDLHLGNVLWWRWAVHKEPGSLFAGCISSNVHQSSRSVSQGPSAARQIGIPCLLDLQPKNSPGSGYSPNTRTRGRLRRHVHQNPVGPHFSREPQCDVSIQILVWEVFQGDF